MKPKWRRPLAFLLSAVMVVSLSGTSVYATGGGETVTGGLCEHHTEHNEDCGYSEGTPCGHEHNEDCYTLVENCTHQHTDECYPEADDSASGNEATPSDAAEPTECNHVCGEDCITEELNCQHEHDVDCGYEEAAPCGYICTAAKAVPLQDTFSITVVVENKGGVVLMNPGSAAEGTNITLYVMPYSGYHFDGWEVIYGDNKITYDDSSNACTFTMPGQDVTVRVLFSIIHVESVELDKTELSLEKGSSYRLKATVSPNNAADKSISFASDNPTVASVDQSGNVTAISIGTATITVTANDGGKTVSCPVTVTPVSLTDAIVALSSNEFIFDGTTKQPTVTVSHSNIALTENTDYTVKYSRNGSETTDFINTGTITVTIEGIGEYKDTATASYEIKQSGTIFDGGVKTYKNGVETTVFNYGDTITVKVTPKATGTASANGRALKEMPNANQMAIFEGTNQLTEPQTVTNGTELIFTVTGLDVNSHTLTAKYVGNDNMADFNQDFSITVSPASLTDAQMNLSINGWTYGGTEQSPTASVNGVAESFTYTCEYSTDGQSWSPELPKSGAGRVKAGTYQLRVSYESNNYCGVKTVALNVAPKDVSLSTGTLAVTEKSYDGKSTASFTGLPGLSGILAGDTVQVDGSSATATFGSAAVGDNIPVTVRGFALVGNDRENYMLPVDELSIEGRITKAAAPTIIWPTASDLTYGQKLSDSILSDGSIEYGTFAWQNGNTVPTVENTGYTVQFTPNADTMKNFEAITNTTQTVSVKVEKATPAVSVNAEVSDGTGARQAVLTAAIGKVGEGILPTGTVIFYDVTNTETTIGTAAVENGAAQFTWTGLAQQEYKVKAVYSGDTNYQTANGEITFDASKKPQEALSIADIGTKTYGDSPFVLSTTGGSGTGAVTFESSDSAVLSISGSTATIHKAGEITITATKAADSQYNEATASVPVIVAKKPLTVAAENKTVIVGTQMPDLTCTVSGLVNGDSFIDPEITTTAADTNTIGDYAITISGGTLTNSDSYTVTYIDGTLTVTNRKVSDSTPDDGNSDGGSSSDSAVSNVAKPQYPTAPNTPTTGQTAPAKPDGNGNVSIPNSAVENAILTAKQNASQNGSLANGIGVTVPVETTKEQQNLNITLKAETLDTLVKDNVKHFTVTTDDMISFSLNEQTLKTLNGQTVGDIILEVRKTAIPAQNLSKEAKAALGTRPVYELFLWCVNGGNKTQITTLDGNAISAAIPYVPTAGESTGGLYVVYVDKDGKVQWLTKSSYEQNRKAVIFEISHFGTYGVGYRKPVLVFTDTVNHWAKEDIAFAVSRGLLTGTGAGLFAPDSGITRGQLVTALGRLEGIDLNDYKVGIFTDVAADSEAVPFINWAVQNGIVAGTTATTFSPELVVNQEQLAVILNVYAVRMGYILPRRMSAVTYTDQKQISSWARDSVRSMQQAGVVFGKAGDCFEPYSPVTRAEAASILRRFVEMLIDPAAMG